MSSVLIYNPDFCNTQVWALKYRTTLNGLCQKDYNKNYFSEDFACIDMDSYEKDQIGDNDQSVDGVMGITCGQNNSQALLVELKLGMTNPAQFSPDKAKGKIKHSCDILHGKGVSICDKVFFLYPTNIAPQIRNRINRLAKTDKKLINIEATDVSGFENSVKSDNAITYKPVHEESEILESIDKSFCEFDLNENKFEEICEYWKMKAEEEKVKYNLDECEHIVSVVLTKLDALSSMPNLSDNQIFDIQFYQLEFKSIVSW